MASKIETEYAVIVNNNAWPVIFQGIREKCEKYVYTFIEAKKPNNTQFNRYMDVNPFDHSRVILRRGSQDYINANIVRMEEANRKYILTQGPLPATAGHFWLMVWEQNCRAILMLNKVIEKEQIKCHWYWPYGIGSQYAMDLADVNLHVEQMSNEDHSYYSMRVFKLTDLESNTSREIIQFHYTTWPDFGVPSSPHAFLEFLYKVRASGGLEASVGPPVVHCSAGIGRSGTFCLVDSCLVLIEKNGVDSVNIQEILLSMRKDRMGLIQTPDQLRFSYQAIIEGAKRLHPDNVNCNWEIKEEIPAEEDGPPPPPPKRGESLRKTPTRPLPAIPNSESLDHFQPSPFAHSPLANSKPDLVTNGFKSRLDESTPLVNFSEEKPSLTPPTKELPEAPSSESDDEKSEASSDAQEEREVSTEGLRQRAVTRAALSERIQQIKRRQREAERWNSIKRSLYKPVAVTFGIIICSALAYIYIKH